MMRSGRSRRHVLEALGPHAQVWVDPRHVAWRSGSVQPATRGIKTRLQKLERAVPPLRRPSRSVRRTLKDLEPFAVAPRHLAIRTPIEATGRYRRCVDLLAHEQDFRASAWYREAAARLAAGHPVRHKKVTVHSLRELDSFFETYLLGLVRSLRNEGYDPGKAPRPGSAFVDAEGRLLKSSSCEHRFALARMLGVGPVPLLVIGADARWVAGHAPGADPDRLRPALAAVAKAHR